jgi:replicative DNA helicase
MDEVERDVLAIAREKIIVVERSAKDAARDALLRMEVRHQSEGKPTGICTGLVDLDALTSGFQETEFTIIAGRPSDGKSSLASQIAEHIAVELRIPTQIFSLEMSDTLQMERMISSRAKVNLRKPFLQRDFDNISHASAKISNSPLYFVDRPGISIAEIKNLVRNAVNKHGVKVVVVDYIGLVSAGGQKDSRTLEIGAITSGLKQLAMELKIHVIGISQLNRGNVQDGKNRKPVLSDLRESGNLEQDADNVLLIWNPNKKDEEEEQQWQSDAPYEVRLIIAKQRNGPRNVSVRLLFLPGFTRFETMSRVDDADVPSRVT